MSTTTTKKIDYTKKTICVERVSYYVLNYTEFVNQFCNDENGTNAMDESITKRMWEKMCKNTNGLIKSDDDMEEEDIDNFLDDIETAVDNAKEEVETENKKQ